MKSSREYGVMRTAGTTSGNAGAAVAAYATRMELPEAKLAQVLVYGADIAKIKGFGTEAAA